MALGQVAEVHWQSVQFSSVHYDLCGLWLPIYSTVAVQLV